MTRRDTSRIAASYTGSSTYPDGHSWTRLNDTAIACGYREILGYRGPRQLGVVHNCDHTIVQFNPKRVETAWTSRHSSKIRYYSNHYLTGSLRVSGDVVLSPSCYDAVVQDLVGEIPTDVLLPNLVLELPETLTLHKAIASSVRNLASLVKPGKALADAGLSYSFGLKPLISDLSKLIGLSRRVSKRIQYLSRLSANDYTSFRRSVPVPHSFNVSFDGSTFTDRYSDSSTQVVEAQTTAHAQVFARIIRTRTVSPEVEKKRAMLDATGLSQAGSVLWEAIPFSFVADWFFPAGRALNFLNQQAFEGACAYAQAGYQSHISSTASVRRRILTDSSEWIDPEPATAVIGDGTIRYYLRRAGLPATNSGYHYGVSQGVLSGMLALQKMG